MPDLTVQIKADLTNYIAGMKQAGSISATAASDITKHLAAASQATTDLGGATMSTSMKFQQMRSGMSAARDGMIGITMSGQRADSALMAMGHHFTSLVNETGSLGGAFKALGSSLLGVGGVILALTLAAELWNRYKKGQDEATKSTADYVSTLSSVRQAQLKGEQDGAGEIVRLKILYDATQNHTLSLKDRNLAYDELDRKYPKFFTNADREKTLLGENVIAYNKLATAILAAASAKAYEQKIGENANRAFEDVQKVNDELTKQIKLKQTIAAEQAKQANNLQGSQGTQFSQSLTESSAGRALEESKKAVKDLYTDQTVLFNQNEKLKKMALDSEVAGGFKTEQQLTAKNDKIKEQKTVLADLEKQLKDLQDTEAKWLQAGNKQDFFNLTNTERNINSLTKKIEELKTATKSVSEPTVKGTNSFNIDKTMKSGAGAVEDMKKQAQAISDRNKEIQKSTQATKQFNEEGKNADIIANELDTAFNNAFNSIISGSQNAMQSVVQALEQMIVKLIEAVVEAVILATVLSVISGGSISVIGELMGSSGTLAKGTGISIPGHAEGGITTRAHLAMVGEGREKEAIMPLSKLQNFVNTNNGQHSNSNGLVATITGSNLQLWDVRSKIQKGRVG